MIMKYEEILEFIKNRLSERDLYELLAEELCEASQASLKYIRAAKMNNNSTPVTQQDAKENLIEEIGDVLMIIKLLNLDIPDIESNPKWIRWKSRLENKSIHN